MKTFKEYILETKFTFDLAIQILGISIDDAKNKSKLKSVYLKRAKETHPDTGGTAKDFRDVKDAYDYLSNKTFSSTVNNTNNDEKIMNAIKHLQKLFKENFDKSGFIKYFNEYLKDDFTIDIQTGPDKISYFTHDAWMNVTISNKDKSTVFQIHYRADSFQLVYPKGSLTDNSNPDISYDLFIITTVFHNKRKQEFYKGNYKRTNDFGFLKNPSKLFPKSKMKKMFETGTTGKARVLKKRDVYAFIKTNLNASVLGYNGDTVEITPENGERGTRIQIRRVTMFKTASWQIDYVSVNKENVSRDIGYTSFPENEDFLDILKQLQKIINNTGNPKKIVSDLKKIIQDERARKKQ